MKFHRDRDRLLAEAHARPSSPLDPPVVALRIASLIAPVAPDAGREHLAALCRSSLIPEPHGGARWWAIEVANWSLRWERHTEFESWTIFIQPGAGGPPKAWLDGLPGDILVYTHADIKSDPGDSDPAAPRGSSLIGSSVLDGAASIFTDFKPGDDGITRFLVLLRTQDRPLAGRLVQMVLEIETYRLMALLAFPMAGSAGAKVGAFEDEAGALAARVADDGAGLDDDRALLQRIVALSGEAEALNAQTSFRFRAAAAYYGIVRDRITTLREERIPGMQTIGEFMDRRLAPAMRTCDAVAEREAAVIERIARAGEMLRTRIEIASEATNAALLASMDRRAAAQLRLQRTVEGLSVAAIAYYALSLLTYPVKAIEHAVHGVDATLTIGIMAPIVVALVWLAMRRLRRHDADD